MRRARAERSAGDGEAICIADRLCAFAGTKGEPDGLSFSNPTISMAMST
jgi:hypothetical protein